MSVTKLADGRYQARWRDPDKRQRAQIFPTKGEAEDHLAELRVGTNAGTYKGRQAGAVTLRQFTAGQWMPWVAKRRRPNTVATYDAHLRNWVLPRLGTYRLNEIDQDACQAFADLLEMKGKAPATVHTIYAVLRGALAYAVKRQKIPGNPALGVELPILPEPDPELRLTVEQVRRLAGVIHPRYEIAVWLAAGTGLREGELLGLRVGRIDFLRKRVSVVEQLQNGQPAILKTKKSRRTVPVDDFLIGKINAHLALWPAGPGELLITNELGAPVKRGPFGYIWRGAVKQAGLPKGTRFHDLRHLYASALIHAGLNVKVVQSCLGHASARETLETYSHLWPGDTDLGRGVIEQLFTTADQDRLAL